jgi:hypothetical protein
VVRARALRQRAQDDRAAGGRRSLPGTTPNDFFEAWLRDGAGGTCWPSSHALWALLAAAGFDPRRVVGAMRDTGYGSHGTVKRTSRAWTGWYTRTAAGVDSRPLGRSEICQTLSRDFGLSERLVAAWGRSGSLDDSLEGSRAPAQLTSPGILPFRRAPAVR